MLVTFTAIQWLSSSPSWLTLTFFFTLHWQDSSDANDSSYDSDNFSTTYETSPLKTNRIKSYLGAKGKLEHVNSDCEDNSDAENDIVKRRRGKNKVWKLYLQMNDSDPMRNCSDSVSHLKRIVLKELGSHVYHSKGNVRRESILKCNTHLDCNHFVKVGPGINGNFKIMYSGQHETVTRVPKHGIAPFVKSRVVTAGQLRVTAMNLRNNLTLDTCVPTAVVPSTRQLQNKLSYDKRKSQIPMEIIHDITS